jgi:hypothetical protein
MIAMNSKPENPSLSIGARLSKLQPRDHASMILTPILAVLGVLQVAVSGATAASLVSGGIALLLSAMGGYRSYVAWTKAESAS